MHPATTILYYFPLSPTSCSHHRRSMSSAAGEVDGFEERLRQRTAKATQAHALDTVPTNPGLHPRGRIPNTPLAASTISFLLGISFTLGIITFASGGIDRFWWSTYQLGFYLAAWAAFHWGEFAVTAGWNRDKCSIDCMSLSWDGLARTDVATSAFLLENGMEYHIAHSVAVVEYLLTLYFNPSLKSNTYVSQAGECILMLAISRSNEHCHRHCSHNSGANTAVFRNDTCRPEFLPCHCDAQSRQPCPRH